MSLFCPDAEFRIVKIPQLLNRLADRVIWIMVRKLGELPKFLVFNFRTESFGNSYISSFSSLLFALVQNYSLAFRDHNGKWMLPFVNAIVTLLHCI
jgi:hypothetical protein